MFNNTDQKKAGLSKASQGPTDPAIWVYCELKREDFF